MPVTVRDIVAAIEAVAPLHLAEPWDSVGLQVGDSAGAVGTVLLTIDVTVDVVAQAAQLGAELILAHHPPLFSPVSSIVAGDPVADVVTELIRCGIALYAAHTNLDVAPTVGTAVALARQLGLGEGGVLRCGCAGAPGADGEPTGAGRVCDLPGAITAQALAETVRCRLEVETVLLFGDPSAQICRFVAIPGAGGDGLAEAAAAGAQAVVTGELKHHELLEALARGLVVVLAGHRQTERPVLTTLLRQHLQNSFPGLTVAVAVEDWPQTIVTG